MKSQVLNIDDVVEKLEDISLDVNAYYKHLKRGTLPDYYQEVVQTTATDIVFFPLVNQEQDEEFDPLESSKEVSANFPKVVEIIATMFQKDKNSVALDLTKAIQRCPIADLKAARLLKKANKLH